MELAAAVTRYPHTAALVDGKVRAPGIDIDFVDFGGDLISVFRNMASSLAYDASELGVSTAVCAREQKSGLTALPVFVTRRFDHEAIYVNARSGVESAADLEGRTIGLRSYTVADVVWACGVLVEQGAVAAVIGYYHGQADAVRPLVDDLADAERRWRDARGYVPIHHTVVVRDVRGLRRGQGPLRGSPGRRSRRDQRGHDSHGAEGHLRSRPPRSSSGPTRCPMDSRPTVALCLTCSGT
jgi:hypothetical protein